MIEERMYTSGAGTHFDLTAKADSLGCTMQFADLF